MKQIIILLAIALYSFAYEARPLHEELSFIGSNRPFTNEEANLFIRSLSTINSCYISNLEKSRSGSVIRYNTLDSIPLEKAISIKLHSPIEKLPLSKVQFTFKKDFGDRIKIGDWVELSIIIDTTKSEELLEINQAEYPLEEFELADTIQCSQILAMVLTKCSRQVVKDEIVSIVSIDTISFPRPQTSVDTLSIMRTRNSPVKITYPSTNVLQRIEKKYESSDIEILNGNRSNGSIARDVTLMKYRLWKNHSLISQLHTLQFKDPSFALIIEAEIEASGSVKSCKIVNKLHNELYNLFLENFKTWKFRQLPYSCGTTSFRYRLNLNTI